MHQVEERRGIEPNPEDKNDDRHQHEDFARAQVEQGTDTSRPPRLGWKARGLPARDGNIAQDGVHAGVWLTTDAEPVAIFDMNDSLTWLFGSRVKRMWPVGGWPNIVESKVIADMPTISWKA